MKATDEQIERVRLMLECCDDWDEDEQAAVEAVLAELATLRAENEPLQSQLTPKGEELERQLLEWMKSEAPVTIAQIAAEARRIVTEPAKGQTNASH